MAFSATILGQGGVYPGFRIITGSWSGAAGDAAGTVSFGGAFQGSLWFDNDANTNSNQIFPAVSSSSSGNISTITVQNQDNVTNGTFIIFALGN